MIRVASKVSLAISMPSAGCIMVSPLVNWDRMLARQFEIRLNLVNASSSLVAAREASDAVRSGFRHTQTGI
jgi:hypothetical protein